MHPFQHQHLRKRIYQLREEYPHPDPRIKFLDNFVMIVGIISPITAVPQIYEIWAHQNAQGVSTLTWILYFLFTLPFVVYGIVHREKPIWIMNVLWLIVIAAVVMGTLVY